MSFQDVGKPGSRPNRSHLTTQPTIPEASTSISKTGPSLAQVSDGILQYQRNVGILERISRMVGTKADGPELELQYNTQVDVLTQLGDKLETQLALQEKQLEALPRTEAAKQRATHIKLVKDFRRVESTFKNITLETRRNRARQSEQVKNASTDEPLMTEVEGDRMHLELQLQQEKLNQEIMREREEEIRNINRGMHQVNEIYKDLAHIVGSQQEQVDQIENQMEQSKANAEQGLSHIQKANLKASQSQCLIS